MLNISDNSELSCSQFCQWLVVKIFQKMDGNHIDIIILLRLVRVPRCPFSDRTKP